MQDSKLIKEFDLAQLATEPVAPPLPRQTLRYIGPVTRATNERILHALERADGEAVALFITSPGGATGTAMSFFDTVRHVLCSDLTTIGSGDVDSSAILIFLAGEHRYLTKRTTLLIHPAGRVFGNQRYTTREMEAMLAEDRLKDAQYAALIAERSHGKLVPHDVRALMEAHTVLTPEKAVELGLADAVLS